MDCKTLLEQLNLYIDGELAQGLCEELEFHLKDCDRCRIVLDTTQKTITFYREQQLVEIPSGVKSRLHDALRAQWKKSG